jgi:hypothetical protein
VISKDRRGHYPHASFWLWKRALRIRHSFEQGFALVQKLTIQLAFGLRLRRIHAVLPVRLGRDQSPSLSPGQSLALTPQTGRSADVYLSKAPWQISPKTDGPALDTAMIWAATGSAAP